MELRSFKKDDVTLIVDLWNRRISGCFATAPLSAERFLEDVVGKHYFEPDGLVLGFEGSRLVAFAHAGFKSSDYIKPDPRFGTISMICAEAEHGDAGLLCIDRAVKFLLARGAWMVEAFTIDFPNTPFYNGLYGGEKAGMDEEHPMGLYLMREAGFNISNGAVVMTCDLKSAPSPAKLPDGFKITTGEWDSPMKGLDPRECYGIPEKIRRTTLADGEGRQLGGITFWHLDRYNKASGERMAVVSHVGVNPEARGTGAAAALQGEVHRILMEEGAEKMGLGTGGRSIQAIRFYRKLGYETIKPAYYFHLDWRRYGDFK